MGGNPVVLLCDSDAVSQVIQANQWSLFEKLKATFSIQPCIVPEVNIELGRFKPIDREFSQLKKKGHLRIASKGVLEELGVIPFGDRRHDGIAARAERYNAVADMGEAALHALSVELDLPVLSNDGSAIRALEAKREQVKHPVLRVYDVFALAVQCGWLTCADVDVAYRTLHRLKAGTPPVRPGDAFVDSLSQHEVRVESALHAASPKVASNAYCWR